MEFFSRPLDGIFQQAAFQLVNKLIRPLRRDLFPLRKEAADLRIRLILRKALPGMQVRHAPGHMPAHELEHACYQEARETHGEQDDVLFLRFCELQFLFLPDLAVSRDLHLRSVRKKRSQSRSVKIHEIRQGISVIDYRCVKAVQAIVHMRKSAIVSVFQRTEHRRICTMRSRLEAPQTQP